jgi:peptidoglycan biosynthesis protein MviN/MurJ (putative lipid II flippase)
MPLTRRILTLNAINLFQFGLAIVVQSFIARTYGTRSDADAYVLAIGIPAAFSMLLGTGLTSALIVFFNEQEHARGVLAARSEAARLLTLWFGLSGVVSGMLIGVSGPLVATMAPELPTRTLDTAARLLRILSLAIPFQGVGQLLIGLHYAEGRFYLGSMFSAIQNGVILAILLPLGPYSVDYLAVGWLLGVVVAATSLWYAYWPGRWPGLPRRAIDVNVLRFARLAMPLLIVTVLVSLIHLSERYFGSSLEEGGLAALGYAHRMVAVAANAVSGGVSVVLLPLVSALRERGELNEIHILSGRLLLGVGAAGAVAGAALFLFAEPVLQVALGYGAFANDSIQLTAQALHGYCGVYVNYVLNDVPARTIIALKRQDVLALNALGALIVYLLATPLLRDQFGITGVALGSSAAFLTYLAANCFASRVLLLAASKVEAG